MIFCRRQKMQRISGGSLPLGEKHRNDFLPQAENATNLRWVTIRKSQKRRNLPGKQKSSDFLLTGGYYKIRKTLTRI